MKRDFNEWLSRFKSSISDYTYYVDFEKIYKNVDKLKVELNKFKHDYFEAIFHNKTE